MPPVILAAAGVGFTVAGASAIATGLFWIGTALQFVGLGLLSAASAKLLEEEAGDVSLEREFTVRSTRAAQTFVYGRALVGGVTVYHNAVSVGGDNNRMYHMVSYTGHEVNDFLGIYLDDEYIPSSRVNWSPDSPALDGEVQSGRFRGNSTYAAPTFWRWYLGTDTDSADLPMKTNITEWTEDHRGRGHAHAVLEIRQIDAGDQTSNVFQKGFPSNLKALIEGKKVYDPRKYSLNEDPIGTKAGSGSAWTLLTSSTENYEPPTDSLFTSTGSYLQQINDDDTYEGLMSSVIPCDPNSIYTLTVKAERPSGDRAQKIGVMFWDGNGKIIHATNSGDAANWPVLGEHHYVSSGAVATTWSDYTMPFGGTDPGSATIPSCASFMAAVVEMNGPGTTNTTMRFTDGRLFFGISEHHVNTPSTWEWSDSPPLCIADYMRDYKIGAAREIRTNSYDAYELINWYAVNSAAAYCAELVDTPSGTQARFTMNGAGTTGEEHRTNIEQMLLSFHGKMAWVQSGWIITGGYQEPVHTFNKNDFRGDISIKGGYTSQERWNHVSGVFVDPEEQYQVSQFPTISAAEFIARDNSMELVNDLQLQYTNDWYMAQRVAFNRLEQGDNQLIVKAPLKMIGLKAKPGQFAALDFDVFSFNNQNFYIQQMKLVSDRNQFGVDLQMQIDYSASYVDPAVGEYIARGVQPTLVSSENMFIPVVSSVTVTPGEARNTLEWINPAGRSFEWIDLYASQTNVLSDANLIASLRQSQYVHSVRPRQTWYYWFQTRDFATNTSSFEPASSTTSYFGTALFPAPPDPENVFTDEFEYIDTFQFLEKWQKAAGADSQVNAITFPESGVYGGRVLNVDSNMVQYISKERIPYDPNFLYRMEAKVKVTRRATIGTGAGSGQVIYLGTTHYKADRTTPINATSGATTGNAHHFVRYAHSTSGDTLNSWYTYAGYLKGTVTWPYSGSMLANAAFEPSQHGKAHPATRYISPHFYLNFNGGDGEMSLDYIRMQKITKYGDLVYDPGLGHYEQWHWELTTLDLNPNNPTLNYPGDGPMSVDGEYNTFQMDTTGSGIDTWEIVEKAKPDFHLVIPNSVVLDWRAKVWVGSAGTAINSYSINLFGKAWGYTRNNSPVPGLTGITENLVYRTTGVGGSAYTETIIDFNKWVDVSGKITLNVNSITNPLSYPPPYYAAIGIYWTQGGATPNSNYVTQMDASIQQEDVKESQIAEKNANYTFAQEDSTKTVKLTGGTARTFTVPADSAVPFAAGTLINVATDTASLGVAPDTGVSLYTPGDGTSGTRYITTTRGRATLQKISSGTWEIFGNID